MRLLVSVLGLVGLVSLLGWGLTEIRHASMRMPQEWLRRDQELRGRGQR